MPNKDSAQDSGTESAETSVDPGAEAVDDTQAETSKEETPVDETPSETAAEAAAEPEAAEEPVVESPAEEPTAPAVSGPKKKRRRMPRSERHKHSKPPREKPASRRPITRGEKPATSPAPRQERRGIVVSDKGEKTIVVKVDVTKLHPKYKKVVRRTRKFHAHDEQNAAGVGDVVRIVESRPISKTKNWRLAEIVEKAR
jgi:small subunit ribosomal protein S17